MNDKEQEHLVSRIQSMLDDSLDSLDSGIQRRLDGIRHNVMQHQSDTVGQLYSRPHPGMDNGSPETREREEDQTRDLVTAIVTNLDNSQGKLDPAIATRLDQARTASLTAGQSPQRHANLPHRTFGTWFSGFFPDRRFTVPASAFAGLCVLVSAVTLVTLLPGQRSSPELAEADVLLFASSEDIELYDNLEFYLWLADNGLPN